MNGMKTATPVHKFHSKEFSTAETIGWMNKTFGKAKENFSELFSILDTHKAIPDKYLSYLTEDGLGVNRTLRFYRVERLISMIAAVRSLVKKGKSGIKELSALCKNVLIPFDESWLSLFNKLDAYYGDSQKTAQLRETYTHLQYTSKVFQGGAGNLAKLAQNENEGRNLDLLDDDHKSALNAFVAELAKLPRHTKLGAVKAKPTKVLEPDKPGFDYNTDDLLTNWGEVSRYHDKVSSLQISDLAKEKKIVSCTLKPKGDIYWVTVKLQDGSSRPYKFKIVSDCAKAFIDLLIDYPEGIVKPRVIAKKGTNINFPTKHDFRLAHFNSTIKHASSCDKFWGSKDFWKSFILRRDKNTSDRMVRLGISKYFVEDIFGEILF